MVRGGFKFVNQNENDYRYNINNAQLHQICGTSDVSYFIRSQQHHYAAHIIRMSTLRSLTLLAFNDDHYSSKSLLDQVVDNKDISISQYCLFTCLTQKVEI